MKRSFFQAAVMSILLYGCTTWTLTKRMGKKLDCNYTRMLRAILNKSRRQHPTKQQLYGHLPPITKTVKVRRTRHAGHSRRSRDELISDVHGRAKAGQPARTCIQHLCVDRGCSPEDLPEVMNDREGWREMVRDICADGTTRWYICVCVCVCVQFFLLFLLLVQKEKNVDISKWIGPTRDLYFLEVFFRSYIRVCFQFVAFVKEHMWHKAIWMGHPMRREITRVSLLVECFSRFCIDLYRGQCFWATFHFLNIYKKNSTNEIILWRSCVFSSLYIFIYRVSQYIWDPCYC